MTDWARGYHAQAKDKLRDELAGKTRLEAWDWAIGTLLPHSSKSIVFNLNHYRTPDDPDEFLFDRQSNATASSIDYVVQQNAFVIDLESHSTSARGQTGRMAGGTASGGATPARAP